MGTRIRQSPYFEATQRQGCHSYTVYNHMYLPNYYDDLVKEYWKIVNEVALWDVSVERIVEITGLDAFRFTNLLTPRNLSKCKVGQCKYVVITDGKGGIINDPVLLRLEENRLWLALADSDVLLWAKGLAVYADMRLDIREADVYPLQVQGPQSKGVVQNLFGEAVLRLAYYEFMEAEVNGIPVIVARTGWTGEVGYEIYLRDSRRGLELWEAVLVAGQPYNIAPTGPSDIRRIEAGILNYGADMTLENNPYEVGLDWMVDFQPEADFIGKEALKRIAAEGVKRKLVGVEIAGEPLGLSQYRWPVRSKGRLIGQVTSAVYSPRLEKNIGYALVPIEYADLGTQLTVEPPTGEITATVVPRPFIDPKKEIPKA
ncbi:MAG: glycine cleavage system protein T [Chloroflexi bacterium]|nr:glycine cleavage system protein T [Chloroflexota bacterium]